MRRVLLAWPTIAFTENVASVAIIGMFDPTGQPLADRLFAGSGIAPGTIVNGSLQYVGVIDNGQAQSGLFDQFVLNGAQGSQLTRSRLTVPNPQLKAVRVLAVRGRKLRSRNRSAVGG